MKMLEEMMKMGKKKGSIPEGEKEAKMSVLKEIADMASQAMADDVKGLKQVTVAAPDKEGLEKGLEKAQEMVDGESEGESEEEGPCENCGKKPCECESKLSPEEMEMFKKLQAKMKA